MMVIFKVRQKDKLRKIVQCPECDSGDLTFTTFSWRTDKPADKVRCRLCGWEMIRDVR